MAVGIEERRVLIVGLGLIGGSLAAALRSAGFGAAKEGAIHACDPDPDEIRRGIEMGLIDRGDTRMAEVAERASIIVPAVPVLAMRGVMAELATHLGSVAPDAVIIRVDS